MAFRARHLGPAWLFYVMFCGVCLPAPAGSSCGLNGVVIADGEDGASALIEVVLGSVIKALIAGDEGSAARLTHTAIRLDSARTFAVLALAMGQQPGPATRGGLGECGIELAAGLEALAWKLRMAHTRDATKEGTGGGGLSALEQVCARYFIAHRPRLAVRWMGMLSGAADAALLRQGSAPGAHKVASAEFQAAVPSMIQVIRNNLHPGPDLASSPVFECQALSALVHARRLTKSAFNVPHARGMRHGWRSSRCTASPVEAPSRCTPPPPATRSELCRAIR